MKTRTLVILLLLAAHNVIAVGSHGGRNVSLSALENSRMERQKCDRFASKFRKVSLDGNSNGRVCHPLKVKKGPTVGKVCAGVKERGPRRCLNFIATADFGYKFKVVKAGASQSCNEKARFPFQSVIRYPEGKLVKKEVSNVCLDEFSAPKGSSGDGCCNSSICIAFKVVAVKTSTGKERFAYPDEKNDLCRLNKGYPFVRCKVDLICRSEAVPTPSCELNKADFCFAYDASGSLINPSSGGSTAAFLSQLEFIDKSIRSIQAGAGKALGYGIVEFSSSATIKTSLSNAQMARNIVQNIPVPVGAATNIGAALQVCNSVLSPSSRRTRVLVLITDGLPSAGVTSSSGLDSIANSIKASGVTIITVGAGGFSPSLLSLLSSSGKFIEVDDILQFSGSLVDLLDEICEDT
mmetsp:Transcript_22334/g.32244  ORF Transcript_22334/g.32244 Transcript_22334/m.32244 type:complete len:408 (-) Transcript_22334:312-1535(-)